MEKHARTIFKTLSWRVLATSTTMLIVYIFTKNTLISASVSITEMAIKTIIYYMHERIWDKTNFGRKTTNLIHLKSRRYKDFSETRKDKKTTTIN